MAWLLWPDGSLCDGFEGLAARHPSAALKDVAPGGCASVNGRRYPRCGMMRPACGSPSRVLRACLSPQMSSLALMASIPVCAPKSSVRKRSTFTIWACVLRRLSRPNRC